MGKSKYIAHWKVSHMFNISLKIDEDSLLSHKFCISMIDVGQKNVIKLQKGLI